MIPHLLFRLYGAMAAWGDIAVGERRPSLTRPGKSSVVGLLAAALGIRRDQEAEQAALANAYRVAVRVDLAGESLRDYHTVQVAPERRGPPYITRADEISAGKLHTMMFGQ